MSAMLLVKAPFQTNRGVNLPKGNILSAIPSKDRTVRISSDNTNEIGNLSIYI